MGLWTDKNPERPWLGTGLARWSSVLVGIPIVLRMQTSKAFLTVLLMVLASQELLL
jgi:hypothetical protein